MMDSMVSVIVPVYNTAKYIDVCIHSILHQDYRNFELILVDDGSTDGSAEICDRWAKKDEKIRVIHQPNQGVSAARNCGIKLAKGDFVAFVDSDDWMDTDYLSALLNGFSLYPKTELVVTGFIRKYQDDKSIRECPSKEFLVRMCSSDANSFVENIGFFYGPFSKLYRLDIIKKNNIIFPEDFSLGEDLLFNFKYLEYVKQAILLPVSKYYYRQLLSGNLRLYRGNRFDIHYYEWHAQVDFLKKHGMWKESAKELFSEKMWAMIYEGVFCIKKPTLAYLKRLLSIKEIKMIREYRNVFQTKLWIKTLILSRNYFLLYLIRMIKG